jgi:hypothetical protein
VTTRSSATGQWQVCRQGKRVVLRLQGGGGFGNQLQNGALVRALDRLIANVIHPVQAIGGT